MSINNYNKSDSGIDIECCVQLDADQSQRNFNDNFIEIEYGSLKGKWLYVDYGNLMYGEYKSLMDEYFDPRVLIDNTRENRVKLMKYFKLENEYCYYSEMKKIDDVDDLIDSWDNLDNESRIELFDEVGIDYELELDYIVNSTRGYCQGDYAEYVIVPKALRECWGTPDDIPDDELVNSAYIDSLFWDSPMTCRVEVNGEEIYIDEYDGQYQGWKKDKDGKQYYWGYDKDIAIEEVVKYCKEYMKDINIDRLIVELKNTLPDEMNYPSCY